MSQLFNKYEKVPPAKRSRLLEMPPALLTHDALREELDTVDAEIRHLHRVLAQTLPGKLLVSGSSGRPRFYLQNESGKHYLPREEIGTAAAYAQQEYYAALLTTMEQRRDALASALRQLEALDPQLVFRDLPEKRQKLVVPEYLPDEDFLLLWSEVRYEGKGFREGDKEYYTARGERVRSKSESDIADRCYYRGIFYLYEYPWTLSSGGVWFPDFTVFNARTRKVYIWEHFGMEDDPGYALNSMRKLRLYQESGLWPGEDVIFTHETTDKPLTIHDIDAVADHYLV